MRSAPRWALIRASLEKDRRTTFASVFGIALGIGALTFFVSLGLGVGALVRTKIFPSDARIVEVVPPPVALGGLLGGGKLDDDTVERLAKLPGVERAFKKMNVRVPAVSRYDGDFFGRRLRMGVEVIAVGVEADWVAADVPPNSFVDPKEGSPIPAVISTRLLEIYNKTFAPARGLPQLGATMVQGFTFPVEFNRSFVAPVAEGVTQSGSIQVAGASDRGSLAGMLIPLATAQRLNAAFNADATTFSAVSLLAASPGDVAGLVARVKDMGLSVDDSERRMAENAGAAVTLTTLALSLLSALICLLGAFNIAHALAASVRARERELAVMRAVGATAADIRGLVQGEALVLGALGALVGTAGAAAASFALDALSATVLPNFPFKPESFFERPWLLFAGALGLGMAAAWVGALGPARRAGAVDPARALAGA